MEDQRVIQSGQEQLIKDVVREHYGAIARDAAWTPPAGACCCGPTGSCGCGHEHASGTTDSACAGVYSPDELGGLPSTVTEASLGCGNPTAMAGLQPGEVVLDLGSGGGIDCFLAAQRVGPSGRVIGLDMTLDMISLARNNAKKVGLKNVEFRWGEMEEMPLEDASVDVVISNCVINLSPDKDQVLREAYRVLRPGGRLHVSDMVLRRELPAAIGAGLIAWACCVAGALRESDFLDKLRAAGFRDVRVDSAAPVTITEFPEIRQSLQQSSTTGAIDVAGLDDSVISITVSAHKPSSS